MARAAFFAAGEPIPRLLLLATVGIGEVNEEDLRGEDALKRLTDLGMAEEEVGGAVRIHRLVAAFARQTADEGAQPAVEDAVIREAHRLNNAGLPAQILVWQPHLRMVTENARNRDDERAALLCDNLGYHLWTNGDLKGARPYMERSLAIREQVLGAEHPITAASLDNLGVLLQKQGNLAEARPYLERSLAIREQVLGAEHPVTAVSLNNLGGLLQRQGDLAGAQPFFERSLAIREKMLGGKHPDTALSLNNLGELLVSQEKLAEAQPILERALAICEEVLGAEHPRTAVTLNNLGGLRQCQGDNAGARMYYERALAIREKSLGADHPETKLVRKALESLDDRRRSDDVDVCGPT